MHSLQKKEKVQQLAMSNIPIIIMAAGLSSRMKDSYTNSKISKDILIQSNQRVKGFIQISDDKEPIIYYIIQNCINAGIKDFYFILGKNSEKFQDYLKELENKLSITTNFIFQDFYGKSKPAGTSDAIFQALNQYKSLKKTRFLVCNSDNIYSAKVIKLLIDEVEYPSMIAYDHRCLNFSDERLSSFSILQIKNNFLQKIIEKPSLELLNNNQYQRFVSMNIFSFFGNQIYPYLEDCPINPDRGEKEIATAIQNMINDNKHIMKTFKVCEYVPDMTYKDDIIKIDNFLR